MNRCIQKLLNGQEENRVLPFFWQHGEDEATIRNMMKVIHEANCGAVCVESRPHPDFCGEKWWADMDVILDEARKRGMKVWILDDSHFPTGYANGAVLKAPEFLCKQAIFTNQTDLPEEAGEVALDLREAGLLTAPKKKFRSPREEAFLNPPPARVYNDDRILRAALLYPDGSTEDVTGQIMEETLRCVKREGPAALQVLTASRNAGYHREYINVTDADSVRLLIDAVYEPHWQHYAADFGKTIAGFFSDEPELGNGTLYEKGNTLGTRQDLPWGRELEEKVREALGEDWRALLPRLWQDDLSPETARAHYVYMDLLTRLIRKNFSEQLGSWCRDHGVQYIGHLIEDDGQHCRTGSSLGHYFRALKGQDMAGIDDVGGQVLPQGEDAPTQDALQKPRSGTFYHYALAKLAESAAAIEPAKHGRSMCEIFGNYGWVEGVRMEKYLADHFLVRGVNHFVPHAFTGKAFPDPDCPPHFYAQGHNPQYRHFGRLVTYMNRVATLTSSGKHQAPIAILYHGEAEWSDRNAMPLDLPARALYDRQMDYHIIPADVFENPSEYQALIGKPFMVNDQAYEVFVVPGANSLCRTAADGLAALAEAGLPVLFVGMRPVCLSENGEPLPGALAACPVVTLEELPGRIRELGIRTPEITPVNDRIRLLWIEGDTPVVMAVNEGTEPWTGRLKLPELSGSCVKYDAWANELRPAKQEKDGAVFLTVAPLKSVFIVWNAGETPSLQEAVSCGKEVPLAGWTRCLCEGTQYPHFSDLVETRLPDGMKLAEEQPEFSGYVRYETAFTRAEAGELRLVIEAADEGVEVFLNGVSQGIQIAAPFEYTLQAEAGENRLAIEVATTLERQCYPLLEGFQKMFAHVPSCGSGITGPVHLYETERRKAE